MQATPASQPNHSREDQSYRSPNKRTAPGMLYSLSVDPLTWSTRSFLTGNQPDRQTPSLITMIATLVSRIAAGGVMYLIDFIVGTIVKSRALIALKSSWVPSPRTPRLTHERFLQPSSENI